MRFSHLPSRTPVFVTVAVLLVVRLALRLAGVRLISFAQLPATLLAGVDAEAT